MGQHASGVVDPGKEFEESLGAFDGIPRVKLVDGWEYRLEAICVYDMERPQGEGNLFHLLAADALDAWLLREPKSSLEVKILFEDEEVTNQDEIVLFLDRFCV